MRKMNAQYDIGPMLATGEELASAASQALGEELKFEDISEWVPPVLSFTSYGV